MCLLGLADDMWELPPKLRLALSALIIGLVMWATGTGTLLLAAPFHMLGLPDNSWLVALCSVLIGLALVLGACNSANLIDGLDGLCAGVTAVISVGFFVLAAHLQVTIPEREANAVRLILAIAMLGATVGFLPLNINPARIFMGDAGSMLLGYNCGIIILLFAEYGLIKWVLCGLMVFALPILDTALAIVRRWRNGRPIFQGDRSHFYDQLVDRGFSVRRVVAISYGLSAVFALLGVLPALVGYPLRIRHLLPVYGLVLLVTVLVVVWAKMVRVDERSSADTEQPA
jgi:UDP-GlcNAc:undecaprenyl-phosphate GlcNAc-1-phosphate transferase